MNIKKRISFVLMILLALAVVTSIAQAQTAWPLLTASAGMEGSVGTAFTYQGLLNDEAGNPYNSPCDFRFTLWDAEPNGSQIGAESLVSGIAVSEGHFMAQVNAGGEFGADAFNGEARWLEVSVRCPSGNGGFTTLTPRQQLDAVPLAGYAVTAPWGGLAGIPSGFADNVDNDTLYSNGEGLALAGTQFSVLFGGNGIAPTAAHSDHIHSNFWRTNGNYQTDPSTHFIGTADNAALVFRVNNLQAFRLEPSYISPNVIGGYSGNTVTTGLYGATISGGGANGYLNRVLANFGTIGGGKSNTASGDSAVVCGGQNNNALQSSAVVVGGTLNQANGTFAMVGGGNQNWASNYATVVTGGEANSANGMYSTVSGGNQNTAGGTSTTVGGGENNSTSNAFATVGGGSENNASGYGATIPGGFGASATGYGQMAYASGYFATPGDAQTSLYLVRNTSYNASWTNLYLDGIDDWLFIPNGRTLTFDIFITGRSDGGVSAGYRIQGVIENHNTVLAFIGTPIVTVLGEDNAAWDAQVVAGDTQDVLSVQVKGGYAGETVHWVASIQTVEVAAP